MFAGGGGTSSGLCKAVKSLHKKVNLVAINHWPEAVAIHKANHPWANHICANVESINPRDVIPKGSLNILVASPECTHFSQAAGGRPKLEQRRASAWHILRWLELLKVDSLLVENVPEFLSWGPLNSRGHPIESQKGETYRVWTEAIKSLGYTVDWRILNSADYGAATSRRRLFVAATKGKHAIAWPETIRARTGKGKKKWRAAREIIDWSIVGKSIFTRKKALSPNTIARIITGLKKFGGKDLEPFIVLMEHGGGIRDLGQPLPTITTAKGGSMALVEPYVLSQASGGAPRSTDEPIPTILSGGAHALVQPFIVKYHGRKRNGDDRMQSVEDPISTIDTSNRYALAEPFILPLEGFFRQNAPKSLDDPIGTITQRGGGSLVEPYLVQYNGSSQSPKSIESPLPTISTKDRFALVQPQVEDRCLDIRFRMLQPHELAAAMGFAKNYRWEGNVTKGDVVKMIGNAVEVNTAKALCYSLLSGRSCSS